MNFDGDIDWVYTFKPLEEGLEPLDRDRGTVSKSRHSDQKRNICLTPQKQDG